MTVVFFDPPDIRKNLLPFTYTRPVSEIRIGIFTISEKWKKYFQGESSWLTESYLQDKFSYSHDDQNVFINGAVCPDSSIAQAIELLPKDIALVKNRQIIAFKPTAMPEGVNFSKGIFKGEIEYEGELTVIDRVWKIFMLNRGQIFADFDMVKKRSSMTIEDPHTIVYSPENVFVEEGVSVKAAILNAEGGPIYLGKNSEIGEGTVVRGPFALGEESTLKIGTRIIGDTSIGPFSKVGGEISNSVIFGYSNKAHDGFLGNSVIGEWCNIGADTNTSNLKNNYKKVKLWDYNTERPEETDLQFCGLMMADHAKCGINTMFNTGTFVGVGANVFGAGFPPNFIPSYAWGGADGLTTFKFDKFLEMTEVVMQRRSVALLSEDIKILETVYNLSAKFRTWEK